MDAAKQTIMNNIFGDSDDELEEVVMDLSDEEEIQLPSFKKSIQKIKLKKIKEPAQVAKVPAQVDKLSEAANDIDDILKRLKPAKAQTNLSSEILIDETINTLMDSMRTAAFNDQEFNKNNEPAIAKLKLLPSLMVHLSKTSWYGQFLDAGILECVKFWMEPLADGSLPSLDIQKSMVEVLNLMPIDTHHLRSSLVGRVVMCYTKCPKVSPVIKRKCEVMIRRWMRPILGKSSNHKHKVMREMRYDAPDRVQKKSQHASGAQSILERANRAVIPQKLAPAFNVVPVSSHSTANSTPASAKSGKYRKLKSTMKMMGRK